MRVESSAVSRNALGVSLLISVIFVVVGSRLSVLERFGTDMPWWDQWSAEGEALITPWLQHHEFWENLVVPHSEHRLAPTKALNLGLIVFSGQWDARLECVINAGFFAALAAALLGWVRGRFDLFWSLSATALVTLLLSLPLAVENILGGFQSVFLFLLGLSLLAIYYLMNRPAGSPLWLLGFGAGCLSLLNMGSGFFFSIPIIGVTAFRLSKNPRRPGLWVTLTVSIGFLVAGCWIHPVLPWQNPVRAADASEFLLYFMHCLAWPKSDWLWLGMLFWLPWGILAFRWFRSSSDWEDSTKSFILAGGGWTLLQLLAVSYARGSGGGYPASRYVELLTFGLICSFLSIPLIVQKPRWRPRHLHLYLLIIRIEPSALWSRAPFLIGAIWSLSVASTALYLADPIYETTLPARKTSYLESARNVQGYLITNDFRYLKNRELPLFAGEPLARVLAPPELRSVLPASVRAPISLEPDDESGGFRLNGTSPETFPLPARRFWGSYDSITKRGPATWRSEIIPVSRFAYWKIEVTGALGRPGSSFQVTSARTGKVLSTIAPTKSAGTSWRAAYTRTPDEPVRLVAQADSPAVWFAFSEPVEMSNVSYWTWQLVKIGRWFFAAGLVLAAAGLRELIRSQRQQRSAFPAEVASDLGDEHDRSTGVSKSSVSAVD